MSQPPASSARPVTIAVIGLGYVGLPLAHGFLRHPAATVIGIDTDPAKAEALHASPPRPYLKHLGEAMYQQVGAAAAAGRFLATTDHGQLARADVVIVCVPTPLDSQHKPDLSYVVRAAQQIAACLKPGQIIVLESTTYPGTTRGEFLAPLRAARPDLVPGRDYFVAFSPEREDPGNAHYTTTQIPKLVGGLDAPSTAAAAAIYRLAFDTVIEVESAEVAEAAKILENTFRAVNIALVNELKVVLGAMGIDIWQVIAAAKSKPFGFMPFYPGPGLGGHCIPIDPFYLSHKAREIGVPSEFIELAGKVNTHMPEHVVRTTLEALMRTRPDGRAAGARVLVLGLAYKPDIDDVRESPSFVLIEGLQDAGCHVDYSDPHIAATHRMRKHDLQLRSVELTAATIASYDAVLIATNHRAFDYALVASHARLIIDTRNAMAPWAAQLGAKLIKA